VLLVKQPKERLVAISSAFILADVRAVLTVHQDFTDIPRHVADRTLVDWVVCQLEDGCVIVRPGYRCIHRWQYLL
jgi:hypothetical protein